MSIAALLHTAQDVPARPHPRHDLSPAGWRRLITLLAAEPAAFLALWADTERVMALFSGADGGVFLVSTVVAAGAYEALSPVRPEAAWGERLVRDLWGHHAQGGDERPLLDHGYWPVGAPLAARPSPRTAPPPPEAPPEAPGAGCFRYPLGPVQGLIDPSWRLDAVLRGESVVALEPGLGFGHRAIPLLARGKPPRAAARFAARIAADSTVAHALAFARATEAVSAAPPPPRAAALREVMAAIEHLTTAAHRLGAILRDTGRPAAAAPFAQIEELWRTAARAAFGHRLMLDCVVPGGIAADLAPAGAAALAAALANTEARRGGLAGGLGEAATAAPLAAPLGAIAGAAGAVRARLDDLPAGPVFQSLAPASGEGLGTAMGPRGAVWHWLRLDHGLIAAFFPADPAPRAWPRFAAACRGRALADLPLLAAGFALSAPGVDL